MDLKITNKTDEPLLSRVKVEGEVSFDNATPSRADIQASIAKSVKKDAKLVDVDHIETGYGKHSATVTSYVYQSEEMIGKAKKLGKKAVEKIKKAEEDAKKAEEEKKKAAEEAKAAAAEEKKEEAAPEEKAEEASESKEEKPEEKEAPAEEKPAEEAKKE